MGERKHHTSHEEKSRFTEVVYARKMRERQIFMEDLEDYRNRKEKKILNTMIKSIGPKWYQALSVHQTEALDSLKMAIYHDHLEGLPTRSLRVIKVLGIHPRPSNAKLMEFVNHGVDDPKDMLSSIFEFIYGHTVDVKRSSYDLNARMLMSSILYLGMDNLLNLLQKRFRPDPEEEVEETKPKRKVELKSVSPYLQELVAHLYEPPKLKRTVPLPLPNNLEELNEPCEEPTPLVESMPSSLLEGGRRGGGGWEGGVGGVVGGARDGGARDGGTRSSGARDGGARGSGAGGGVSGGGGTLPKKTLPRELCDKIAGVTPIEPCCSDPDVSKKRLAQTSQRKIKRGNRGDRGFSEVTVEKKVYGMVSTRRSKQGARRKKPVAPTTGLPNVQYTINGVCTVHGRTVYVLGNVSILPPEGVLIHGGCALVNGEYCTLHCGFRVHPPPPAQGSCDCVNKWTDATFQYVKNTKCYCGHHFDYGNEGAFLPDELPFFQKPTRYGPFQFNHDTIFNMDAKSQHIEKYFNQVFEADSMLRVDDGRQKPKTIKKKRASNICLNEQSTPEDYLKCALRQMQSTNVAARLPDAHAVPELHEWMRRRMRGPYSESERARMMRESGSRWQMISTLSKRGFTHVSLPKEEQFRKTTTWKHKQDLSDKFRKWTSTYKFDMFQAQADFNNLLWPSMFQAQLPDKKFREIFFSYMVGRVEDLKVIHPYCSREVTERYTAMRKRQYICRPAGTELL